ncbi:sterol desaturase family protein [Hymenobacter sp.]|uniref:sterol desaturase family protein n=1 Tax=Hymenobacter sp. TaxID=1898978 RepID=UPI00286D45D9|nr:sterol desaturase family protein [Hymenobacter sp.]
MKNVELITTAILLSWVAVVILLERVIPYRKGLPFFREGFWTDLVLYTLVQSFFLKIVIFDYVILPLDQHFEFSKLQFVTGWPVWVQVAFFVITHDFYIYWFHRFQHASPLFWRTHEAHHSGKQVDWLAGSRSHAVEILINQTIEFAPIILLGADPVVVPIKACIDAVWGIWIHANIDVRSGRLQYVINGPEMHLWHHADHKEVFHANFSTKFAFWDWLFGTAYLPGHKPLKWGLYYDFPKDYFLQHVFSVKRFDEAQLLARSPALRRYYRLLPASWQRLRGLGRRPQAAPTAPVAENTATGVPV